MKLGKMKLGKLPRKVDSRTFELRNLFRTEFLPSLPIEYDVDKNMNLTDTNIYANDDWGDCVIAGRAHATLRFECFEQKYYITINDTEVLKEYWKEQGDGGKPDNGLVMLDSLNDWRKKGWKAAGKKYDIYAYAAIDPINHNELKYSVYLLRGAYVGVALPISAQGQFERGQIWDVVRGPDGEVGSWGGHCIYIFSYNSKGPTCMTWGKRQHMTWRFFNKYCDEAYGIVDNKDNWINPATDPLDINKLNGYLNELTKSVK